MPAVSFQAISKTFATPKGPFQALNQVNLDIEEGEFFGLLGPNGAGKTTLISILAGLARATSGRVLVQGSDVQAQYADARRKLGIVPQELVFDPFFNVREALRIQSGYFGVKNNDAWIDELLENLGLADKANANMRQLSGGMKRRVLIAKALSHEPKILFLDEPSAGVDVELRHDMWRLVRALRDAGTTIILTTHYLEEAEDMADRIGVIRKGELIVVEDKAVLMRKLGKKELAITLQQPMEQVPASLARWPLALSQGGTVLTYTFDTQQEDTGIAALLRALTEHGIDFKDLHSSESSLEDIFVSLVHQDKAPTPSAQKAIPA